ncbi:unnamed protein product [Urochloa decumbens]|uniref:aspartate--tRNA ligase n=1 Tax=Urochloa decumbens TaxID=240449 RepID=A0ABC8ZCP7_9POAL
MSSSPPPSPVPATQGKNAPLSAAAAKSPKRKKGDMTPQLAEDSRSVAEDGLGASNGGAISPNSRKALKDTMESTSRPAKPKKPSKEERKLAKAAKCQRQPQEEGADGDSGAVVSRNYGDLPVELFQTSPASSRQWMEVSELVPDAAGRAVLLRGWAQSISEKSKTVEGIVSLPTKPVNRTTQQVEVSVTKIYCISRSTIDLPFNFEDAARSVEEAEEAERRGTRLPHVTLDTRLDNRTIDLRTPVNQSIFKIQSVVDSKFSEYMLSKGFMGIHTPKITPGISEGGSSVFKLNYVNGQSASLAQSPQLYKQMAINAGLKRVFEVGTIFRAEKSNTHRHLCEYIGLHVEMEIKEHYFEVCDVLGELFVELFDHLAEKCSAELDMINKQFPCEPLKYHKETLKLRYAEGIEMLKESGFEIEPCDDLSTQAEMKLGQLVREKYNTDFFILYEFPLAVRPFYTMPCLERPEYSNSFDAFIRGEEIVSGSQRIHCHSLLLDVLASAESTVPLWKNLPTHFNMVPPPPPPPPPPQEEALVLALKGS